MSPAIELNGVRCAGEGAAEPLALSLSVAEGTFTVLLGPSRCGAATVLRLCAGLLVPEEGTVRVLGRDPAESEEDASLQSRLRVGVILQPPGLLSNMTVFNNVALPLRYHADPAEDEVESAVMGLLTALGLASLRDRFPAALTFGEAKVVALARAMVMEPEVLLLEEPDAGLDGESLARCQAVIKETRAGRQVTVLATLSHPSPLLAMADRVVYMRNGRVAAEGPRTELQKSGAEAILVYLGAEAARLSSTVPEKRSR